MKSYLVKRLLGIIPVFLGITLLSFAVMHLAPGSAVDSKAALNPKMTLDARQKLESLYGLDRPLWRQYTDWLGRVARLDFGRSLSDGVLVSTKIKEALPVTLLVNGLSLFFIFLIGVPLGVWSATRAGTRAENAVTTLVFAGFSIPTFWLALILMAYCGVELRILPVTGLRSLFHEDLSPVAKFFDVARHLILPVAVSSLTGLAGVSRFMRQGMILALRENYIRTARAAGLPEKMILYRYALRNALLPVITLVGLLIPALVGGSVLFESLFSLPGMGRLFVGSVFNRDYPVIMGILSLGAILTMLGNLVADLSYAAADPRVRLGRDGS